MIIEKIQYQIDDGEINSSHSTRFEMLNTFQRMGLSCHFNETSFNWIPKSVDETSV